MLNKLQPLVLVIASAMMIVFRQKVSKFIEIVFTKFPKYKDGVETFNFRPSVRPSLIGLLGVVLLLFAITGLYYNLFLL